ncbi:lipopolysaccharide biosynthesis protein [Streptomyces sp. NPDC102441]|uniref:lipopolysaccharide biosynthesis protein n=1 Tax=Streptomyces sp. NPDC102441 TaxID=3366176 RepID=UPI003800762C
MSDTVRAGRPETGTARPPAPADGANGDSMFRNAYALMLSTGVSAALGLGFWLVAARYYTEEAVGQGSAAIAAMRLLASVTATTMIGAVVRYVPRAGRATGSLVARTYLVSSAVVTLACVVFLLTLDLWGDSYAPLGTLSAGLVFTGSCVAWAVLTLQDGVLTGLRKAFWVPVGNAVFSIGKLLLLAAFATALPVLGVFVSWAAAIALSVLPLGWMVFRRLIPRQAGAERDREPPRMREIGRFLAGDSVGALFSLAMINLLPVMVAVRFDAAHNGFFYIAYTVGGTMEFMAINMASSLTAHASHSPGHLAEGVRGALRRMAVLLVPVVVVLVLFAPQILSPFGSGYAAHGTLVLRLLAAAALPRVVVELYIGVLRVQGRTGALAVLQGAMCVLVLGTAAVLLGPAGIAGAGWAMLTAMTAVATASAVGLRTALTGRTPRHSRRTPPGSEEFGTSWARLAARPAQDRPTGKADARTASGGALWLWGLLVLAAGLFWVPLSRSAHAGHTHLTGTELIDALPPVSVASGVLMIVVHSAAVALYRPRPALLGAALLVTVAALHSAPLFLGVRPDAASPEWHGALARVLTGAAGLSSPAAVERALPFALQLLCLAAAAVLLRTAGAHWRVTAAALWVLGVAGWVAQDAFATAGLPVFLGLFAATAVAYGVRGRVSGRAPAA